MALLETHLSVRGPPPQAQTGRADAHGMCGTAGGESRGAQQAEWTSMWLAAQQLVEPVLLHTGGSGVVDGTGL